MSHSGLKRTQQPKVFAFPGCVRLSFSLENVSHLWYN